MDNIEKEIMEDSTPDSTDGVIHETGADNDNSSIAKKEDSISQVIYMDSIEKEIMEDSTPDSADSVILKTDAGDDNPSIAKKENSISQVISADEMSDNSTNVPKEDSSSQTIETDEKVVDPIRVEASRLVKEVKNTDKKKKPKKADTTLSPTPMAPINQVVNIFTNKDSNGKRANVSKRKTSSNNTVKTYDLSDSSGFNSFIRENRSSRLFALVCLLTVYQYVDFDDLNNLLTTLEEILPPIKKNVVKIQNMDENTSTILNDEFNLTMVDMMASVNLHDYQRGVGKIKIDCVKFSNNVDRKSIMKNIVREYKDFFDLVMKWVLDLRLKRQINDKMLIEALSFILDASIFRLNSVVTSLEHENLNRAIYELVFRLYGDNRYKEYEIHRGFLDDQLKDWISWTKHEFVSKLPYAFYTQGVTSDNARSYIEKVELRVHKSIVSVFSEEYSPYFAQNIALIEYILENLLNVEWHNFNGLLNIISSSISEAYDIISELPNSNSEKNDRKRFLSTFFINLLNNLYLEVDEDNPYMPLISNMPGLHVKYYKGLLSYIISDNEMRELLFYVLAEYLLEFESYDKDVSPLIKFFSLLSVVKMPQSFNCIDVFFAKLIFKKCETAKKLKEAVNAYVTERQPKGERKNATN